MFTYQTIQRCFLFLYAFICIGIVASAPSHAAQDYNAIEHDKLAAVAYSYFQIDEDAYPDMSLSFSKFEQHIDTIETEGFQVIAPDTLLNGKKTNGNAPSILITFETGHRSIMQQAVPLLLEQKIPFTIFISPSEIDKGLPYVIGWNELKKLRRNNLVTIGIHGGHYKALSEYKDNSDIEHSVLSAITRYKEVFGDAPLYYAYPYGDHTPHLEGVLKKNGVQYAFGLHSGVIHQDSPLLNLPRFTMTDHLGSTERFVDTAYNLPLPFFDMIPDSTVLNEAPNSLSFSVPNALQSHLKSLQCFHSGIGKIDTEIIGKERIHIPLPTTSNITGRLRVNCTINAGYDEDTERQRWRWHGILHRINAQEDQ